MQVSNRSQKHLTKYFYYLVPENIQSMIQTVSDNNHSNRIFILVKQSHKKIEPIYV